MYLQTLSTSFFETEKAAAESCHSKWVAQSLFSFINRVELSAIIVAMFSSDNRGDRDIRNEHDPDLHISNTNENRYYTLFP